MPITCCKAGFRQIPIHENPVLQPSHPTPFYESVKDHRPGQLGKSVPLCSPYTFARLSE
jgi:hypothetical protein